MKIHGYGFQDAASPISDSTGAADLIIVDSVIFGTEPDGAGLASFDGISARLDVNQSASTSHVNLPESLFRSPPAGRQKIKDKPFLSLDFR